MCVKNACFISGLQVQLRSGPSHNLYRQVHSIYPAHRVARHRLHCIHNRKSQSVPARSITRATATAATRSPTPASSNGPEPVPDLEPGPEGSVEHFDVTAGEAGHRLDKVLTKRFGNTSSRSYLQTMLDDGNVLLNGEPITSKSFKPTEGDIVQVRFITPQRDLPISPEPIPLDILYEDEHIVAVNKPAGMVVHPAPGNWTGTLVHALAHHYPEIREMGGSRPGIVHRLDKGTSGVIVVARTEVAQRGLMKLFASRGVSKEYITVTVGNPSGEGCVARSIEEPVGRSPVDRLRMAVLPVEAGGKEAVSKIWVEGIDTRRLLHLVRVQIQTGRTHQIRVHLRHVRAPVLGDDLYGAVDVNRRFRSAAERAMLHAREIGFRHPVSGEEMLIVAPLAEDMRNLLERVVMPGFEERFPSW